MQKRNIIFVLVIILIAAFCLAQVSSPQTQTQAPPAPKAAAKKPISRRTQRVVPMKEIQVVSPDARVKFTLGSNPERLTYTVMMGESTVVDPSPLDMRVDGYQISSGVIFGSLETYEINETYPWHGAHSTAVNRCNGARVALIHDFGHNGGVGLHLAIIGKVRAAFFHNLHRLTDFIRKWMWCGTEIGEREEGYARL